MSSSSLPASHARWCSGGGRARTDPPTPSNARPQQSRSLGAATDSVGRPGVHPVEPAPGRHDPRADRHRRRSPAVGDPAVALPADVRDRLLAATTGGAGHPGLDPAVPRRPDRTDLPARARAPRVGHDRDPRADVLRRGAARARAPRGRPAGPRVPDRVLPAARVRWRARRAVQRAHRPDPVRPGPRIPDAPRRRPAPAPALPEARPAGGTAREALGPGRRGRSDPPACRRSRLPSARRA